MYYTTVLNLEKRIFRWHEHKTLYFNWNQPSSNINDREYPRTYNIIKKSVIKPLIEENYFFMRKVSNRHKIRLIKLT